MRIEETTRCPHIVSNGTTSYCDLAESAVRDRDEEIAGLRSNLEIAERALDAQTDFRAEIEQLRSLMSRVLAAEGRCPTKLLHDISRVLEDKQ